VYLVGWSLGTAVVIEVAKITGKDAKAVILVDQLHTTDYKFNDGGEENWFNSQVSMYKDFTIWNTSYFKDSIITVRYISLMPSEDKLPDWWKPSIAGFFKWRGNSLKESVSALKIPMRAINASNEKSYEEQWKSFYKDYKLTVFENSNHFLVWQYPVKFNETLLGIIDETSK
jgi:pimeloyl-ACP methyl ester carboxylesterase